MWNGKTPDLTLPRAVRIGIVNFIDSPVVRCSRNQAIRIGISGEAGNISRERIIASECITETVIYVVEALAEVHVMRYSEFTGCPAKTDPCIFMNSTIGWIWILGLNLGHGLGTKVNLVNPYLLI